jgi:hypothetical protein
VEKLIYALCTMTAFACAWLLLRAYARSRARLLLWSGLCFVGLTANNLLVFLDRLVFTQADLALPRLALALASVLVLLVGLVMEGDA